MLESNPGRSDRKPTVRPRFHRPPEGDIVMAGVRTQDWLVKGTDADRQRAWRRVSLRPAIYAGSADTSSTVEEEIVSLGKSMGLEVEERDVNELIEEHTQELTTEEIQELQSQQQTEVMQRSGRPVTATDNAAVAAVRNVVEADRRVTIDEIMIRLPPGIEIGRSSIGTIMSDILNFRKVCARWVPRFLLENHKQQRMEAARAFLEIKSKRWRSTVFPYSLKWHLGGKHFANDDEMQAEENHWLRRQDTAWYNSGIK
ncbi:hypothetical protein LAZ67_18001744 [Cordylochernes scorpioides]|uniref:Transposase n=1 Tax=Cordylochernes scorpioides TaxID=51811 RepID=A0ABY6LIL4_9ARAC|nr:hypothetical protein LAZ67_18001744 [Cordylochernes scorpioides]